MIDKVKVYLDMDGVVADFYKEYTRIKGTPEWCELKFKDLVKQHRIFRNLDWMPNGKALVDPLLTYHNAGAIDLEILSSCGTWDIKVAPLSAEQKTHWLNERGMSHIKKNFVHSFACKKNYAHPNAFLIDDRVDCIEPFIAAGGHGHLHSDDKYLDTESALALFIVKQGKKYADIHIHQ